VDAFALIVVGGVALTVVALLVLGTWSPRRMSEITDKDRHRSWVTQAEIEERDVPQMIEGQNEYRRLRGEEDLTEGQIRRRAAAAQRRSIARGKKARKAAGR
jgi:FtsZ-interacting cell division protein ZipA